MKKTKTIENKAEKAIEFVALFTFSIKKLLHVMLLTGNKGKMVELQVADNQVC